MNIIKPKPIVVPCFFSGTSKGQHLAEQSLATTKYLTSQVELFFFFFVERKPSGAKHTIYVAFIS